MPMIVENNRLQEVLHLDADSEVARIRRFIQRTVRINLRKKGVVVAVSGGVDSAVCALLCVEALGKENVFVLLLPERDSSTSSLRLGEQIAVTCGATAIVEDITQMLEAARCYSRQAEAIRRLFPTYREGWKHKITIPSLLESDRLNVSRLTVESSSGEIFSARMPLDVYQHLVAATNFKQRTRAMVSYYHADRLNYAVCGTPNRLEFDQGFFVKNGDGSADLKPIAHLYKSQVYELARSLGVPPEVCERHPTTDTFPMEQTQEEFYFALPYEIMDACLYAHNHKTPASEVATLLHLSVEQILRIYADIESKRRATVALHLPALTPSPILEIAQMMNSVVLETSDLQCAE